jgi:WD40 repeat protein
MWSKIDGKIIKIYQHKAEVTCLHLSADLKHLVSADRTGVAYLWNTATAKPMHMFNHGEPVDIPGSKKPGFAKRLGDDVTSVALTSDGKLLWTGTEGGSVRLWDVKSGKELCRLYCGVGDTPHWLVTTPDGHFDGSANAWKQVSYRVKGTATILDGDDTRKKMHRPDLLAKILEVKN